MDFFKVEVYAQQILNKDKRLPTDRIPDESTLISHTAYRLGKGMVSVKMLKDCIFNLRKIQKGRFLKLPERYLDFIAVEEGTPFIFASNIIEAKASQNYTVNQALKKIQSTTLLKQTNQDVFNPEIEEYTLTDERAIATLLGIDNFFIIQVQCKLLIRVLKQINSVALLDNSATEAPDEIPTLRTYMEVLEFLHQVFEKLGEEGYLKYSSGFHKTHMQLFTSDTEYQRGENIQWLDLGRNKNPNKKSLLFLFLKLEKLGYIRFDSGNHLSRVVEFHFRDHQFQKFQNLKVSLSDLKKELKQNDKKYPEIDIIISNAFKRCKLPVNPTIFI